MNNTHVKLSWLNVETLHRALPAQKQLPKWFRVTRFYPRLFRYMLNTLDFLKSYDNRVQEPYDKVHVIHFNSDDFKEEVHKHIQMATGLDYSRLNKLTTVYMGHEYFDRLNCESMQHPHSLGYVHFGVRYAKSTEGGREGRPRNIWDIRGMSLEVILVPYMEGMLVV